MCSPFLLLYHGCHSKLLILVLTEQLSSVLPQGPRSMKRPCPLYQVHQSQSGLLCPCGSADQPLQPGSPAKSTQSADPTFTPFLSAGAQKARRDPHVLDHKSRFQHVIYIDRERLLAVHTLMTTQTRFLSPCSRARLSLQNYVAIF